MISQGSSNKRIARDLKISPETVKSHIKRIFMKLGASTRTEAVCPGRFAGAARTWYRKLEAGPEFLTGSPCEFAHGRAIAPRERPSVCPANQAISEPDGLRPNASRSMREDTAMSETSGRPTD